MQISLPSIIMSFPSAIFLCKSTILYLTSSIDDTGDTTCDTSFSLIFLVTSSPFKYTLSPLGVFSISIDILFNNSMTFFSSITPFFIAFALNAASATHLYVLPVSIFNSFSLFAIFLATVPFPLPAVPSIPTINPIIFLLLLTVLVFEFLLQVFALFLHSLLLSFQFLLYISF